MIYPHQRFAHAAQVLQPRPFHFGAMTHRPTHTYGDAHGQIWAAHGYGQGYGQDTTDPNDPSQQQQTAPTAQPNAPTAPSSAASSPYATLVEVGSLAGASLGAYHGYRRNHGSVGWAIGWFVFGALIPVLAIPIMLAEGFGKPEK